MLIKIIKKTFLNLRILGIIVIVALIAMLQIKSCNTEKALEKAQLENQALTDSAKKFRDKNGDLNIQKEQLIGSRKNLIELLKKKDTEVAKLLDNNKVNTVIKYKDRLKWNDSIILVSECFIDTIIGDKWVTLTLKADSNVLKTDIKILNEYTIVDEYVRDKWWKKKYPVITVKSKNPYSNTDSLVTYKVKPKECFLKKLF